jgi:hypothetical protein
MARVAVTSCKIGSFSLKFLSAMYYTVFDIGELLLNASEIATTSNGVNPL